MSIPHFLPFFRWRAATNGTPADLRRRVLAQTSGRPGPPAIALARVHYVADAAIAIDPLETDFRLYAGGIEVRAWVRLPRDDIPPKMVDAIETSTARLESVSRKVRQVFFLSAAYGLSLEDIAKLLRMRRRQVRGAMLEAIAALDERRG